MPHLPLTALRAFECAARSGSFAAAGAELGVTSAAVSQQVRALEDHLGRLLFQRHGNRLTLTDAGQSLWPRLGAAFAELAEVTGAARAATGRARVVLSCISSLAELWAIPALAGFPGAVDLRVEEDPVTFGPEGADLRLTWGGEGYGDHLVEPLFSDAFIPVGPPAMAGIPPGDLPDAALVHTDWGARYGTWPSWAGWFAHAGLSRRPEGGLRVTYTAHALAAARAGIGAALVPARLAARDVAAGLVARMEGPEMAMRTGYVLVQARTSRRADVRALADWMRAAV